MRTIYSAMILAMALLAFSGNSVDGQIRCVIWILDPPGPVVIMGSTCSGENPSDMCTSMAVCRYDQGGGEPTCVGIPDHGPGCSDNPNTQNKGIHKPVVPSLISGRVLNEAVSVQTVSMKEKDGRLVIIADPPAGFPVDKLSTATHDVSVEVKNGMLEITLGKDSKFLGVRFEDMWPQRSAFSLSQNFPNPFNPTTQVAYQLPEAGEVSLVIYNLLGQPIRVLVQGHHEAGYYRVTWDGKDERGQLVSSGIYPYRLKTGPHVAVRKMIFAK